MVARCDVSNPVAWTKEPMYSGLKQMAAEAWGKGREVVARAGDRIWIIGPRNEVDLGEVEQRWRYAVELLADGHLRATVLPPLED